TVLDVQEWIDRVRQQVREDNAELERTGKDEKFYTFTLNEMNHLMLLLAPKASAVQEGWKLVPVTITEAMHIAAVKAILRSTGNDDCPPSVWNAMLTAAPSAPQAEDVLVDLHRLFASAPAQESCNGRPTFEALYRKLTRMPEGECLNWRAAQVMTAFEWWQRGMRCAAEVAA
ncbi:hypothetical protein, partial [Marmoricola sp. RAF53]